MIKESENIRKTTRVTRKSAETSVSEVSAEIEVKEPENDRVGIVLYNERLKKNLNLAEISQVLCIRKAYLEAIEKGIYSELPSMPYSAGFVDAYAKYLGLNNTRITQLFREEINVNTKPAKSFVAEDVTAEVSMPNKFYVVAGIVATVLIAFVWNLLSPSSTDESVDAEKTVVVETVADGNADLSGKVEYFETEQKPADVDVSDMGAEEPSQVVISEESYKEQEAAPQSTSPKIEVKIVQEDTWIEVKDADKVYISKVLHVGESYRFPDVKGLVFSSGKVSGVDVYVNGKIVPVVQPNKKMNIKIDDVLNANH